MYFLIRKSKHVLKHAYHIFRKAKKYCPSQEYLACSFKLKAFQEAILDKDRVKIEKLLPEIKKITKSSLKVPSFIRTRDYIFGLLAAIIAAFGLIRPLWFELYQIPTGSMRPTLKEMDRLTVSKTQFGINIPFTTGHFLFDPQNVLRNGICIFTGEGMDIQDGMTSYFYFFKGFKQYIKRMIGKPEDTVYFYGGKIYGIDGKGQSITADLNPKELAAIDHIPFLNFEGIVKPKGKTAQNVYSPVIFYQSGLPVLKMQSYGSFINSEILYNSGADIKDYYQLFGFEHFGICRIVKKDQLYLEIQHHPSIKGAKVQHDLFGRLMPTLNISKSYIPLNEDHLNAIFQNLYTARFTVKNGLMKRSSQNSPPLDETSSHVYPKLEGVPDGTYEFDRGVAYEIFPQGVTKKLSGDHPLCQYSKEKAIFFFNFGIEFDLAYSPDSHFKIFPGRYTYFFEDDLYLLGSKIFSKQDPTLIEYVQTENDRVVKNKEYVPFIDNKPPMDSNGDITAAHIKRYGLKIPKDSYYVLGDNHAMSADSRRFGFVPEDNLRGVPDILFWPPGSRFGFPLQVDYPLITIPRIIVWILVLFSYLIYKLYDRRKGIFPYKFDE